jgi:hypothetical protein
VSEGEKNDEREAEVNLKEAEILQTTSIDAAVGLDFSTCLWL